MKRYLILIAGFVSLSLGVVGVFLPLLPTTPFLLLSASCFLRSSDRFYYWITKHRIFGNYINNYLKYHAIARKAKTLMYSVDFEEIEIIQRSQDWDALTEIMIDIARRLESGGSELMVICTNTMHKMAEDVQNNINVPLIHIADAAVVAALK